MRSATVRDLRNHFSRIAKWLKSGEEVVITMRGRAIGRIVPEPLPQSKVRMPDFAARIAQEYPHRQISPAESAALRDALRGDR